MDTPRKPTPSDPSDVWQAYYTPERVAILQTAFDRVATPSNWKLAIDARLLGRLSADERALITEAVEFFTGSTPTFEERFAQGYTRVRAAGYYATIGA